MSAPATPPSTAPTNRQFATRPPCSPQRTHIRRTRAAVRLRRDALARLGGGDRRDSITTPERGGTRQLATLPRSDNKNVAVSTPAARQDERARGAGRRGGAVIGDGLESPQPSAARRRALAASRQAALPSCPAAARAALSFWAAAAAAAAAQTDRESCAPSDPST